MNLPELSVRKSVFAWMVMATSIIFGSIGLSRLGVSYLPDVDFPVLSVRVEWPGASPEVMESEIVDRIEKELVNVEGVKEIVSDIRQGYVSISLEFDLSRDVDAAMQELQSYLSQVDLPLDVEVPRIYKSNPEDQPLMWIGLTGERSTRDLFVYADLHLLDRFKLIDGAGEVLVGGAGERNLRVHVKLDELKKRELTVLDVVSALKLQHIESASGYIENDQTESVVRFMGEGISTREVGNILITRRGNEPVYGQSIRIRDVARVEDGLEDLRRMNSISGETGISIGVKKQRGANAVAVGRAIRAEVDAINTELPEDMHLRILFDGVGFVESAVFDTELALLLSAIATVVVVWFSLGSFASTLNIGLAIPTSVLGSFLILYFSGFTLNLFTLLGLSLAIGIVVDDAIMVLENIVRHFDMGKSPARAAVDGTNQVFFAAIATTIVLFSMFVPVAFLSGVTGRFFFQFAVTITGAVALSTLDALTLTPMRASRTLSRDGRKARFLVLVDRGYEVLTELYKKTLLLSFRFRVWILASSVVFLVVSFWVSRDIAMEFVPQQDRSQFGVFVKTKVGSSLHSTKEQVAPLEKYLQGNPDVKDYIAIVGGFSGGQTNQANMIVILNPIEERSKSQGQIMEEFRKFIKNEVGLRAALFDFSSRGLTPRGSYPVEFNIRGPDWTVLKEKGDEIQKIMNDSGLVTGVNMDYQSGLPQLQVIPRRDEAAQTGVFVDSILNTISAGIGGVRAGRFTGDGRRYDVRVRLDEKDRDQDLDLLKLDVRNVYGEMIPVSRVVRTQLVPSVFTMSRVNRQRAVSITARPAEGVSQGLALSSLEEKIRPVIPTGYGFSAGGEARGFRNTVKEMVGALVLGLVVSYIVLGVQFNSFIHPATILLAVPFGMSGAMLSLYVWGQSLNLFSMIGMILLAGLATKNSILIVEFANQIREEKGLDATAAVLEAAPIRLRPIIMTSITALAAALPPALIPGEGAEARIPMALAVSGGILFSMTFSLVIVPLAYTLMAKLEKENPDLLSLEDGSSGET